MVIHIMGLVHFLSQNQEQWEIFWPKNKRRSNLCIISTVQEINSFCHTMVNYQISLQLRNQTPKSFSRSLFRNRLSQMDMILDHQQKQLESLQVEMLGIGSIMNLESWLLKLSLENGLHTLSNGSQEPMQMLIKLLMKIWIGLNTLMKN